MRIFHYHETTGAFIGEGMADPDPLDAGNWLIPAHATTIEPPPAIDGHAIEFDGSAWVQRLIPAPKYEPNVEPQDSTPTDASA